MHIDSANKYVVQQDTLWWTCASLINKKLLIIMLMVIEPCNSLVKSESQYPTMGYQVICPAQMSIQHP